MFKLNGDYRGCSCNLSKPCLVLSTCFTNKASISGCFFGIMQNEFNFMHYLLKLIGWVRFWRNLASLFVILRHPSGVPETKVILRCFAHFYPKLLCYSFQFVDYILDLISSKLDNFRRFTKSEASLGKRPILYPMSSKMRWPTTVALTRGDFIPFHAWGRVVGFKWG